MSKDKKATETETETETTKGYDVAKDIVIQDYGIIATDEKGIETRAEVRSYDGGEHKMSVYKILGKNKDKRRQLFRLPLDEAQAIADFLVGIR